MVDGEVGYCKHCGDHRLLYRGICPKCNYEKTIKKRRKRKRKKKQRKKRIYNEPLDPKANLTSLLIWDFPKDLKKRFKVTCAKLEISMHDAVIQLVRDFSDEEERCSTCGGSRQTKVWPPSTEEDTTTRGPDGSNSTAPGAEEEAGST